MKNMKTIIAGSRSFDFGKKEIKIIEDLEIQQNKNKRKLRRIVEEAMEECPWEITSVVCGLAEGVDSIGKEIAEKKGIEVYKFPALWKLYGKRAGMIRNAEMKIFSEALIAVWDGKSKGTLNMLNLMFNVEKPIYLIVVKEKIEKFVFKDYKEKTFQDFLLRVT